MTQNGSHPYQEMKLMIKYLTIAALVLLTGCAAERIAAKAGADEAAQTFDALGHIEARGVCLVRAGTLVRSGPVFEKTVMDAARVVCPLR